MEKEIKKVIDAIEVPMEKLDGAIYKGIKQGKPKKHRFLIPLYASALAIGLTLCSGFISPKMASVLAKMPFIGFIYDIEEQDKGLQVAMTDENRVSFNQVLESNGVAITVEDIVYDGTRIAFTYTQDVYEEIYPLTVKVNGEKINFSEGLHELESESGFRGLIEIVPVEKLPKSFHLEISIHQIGDTRGDWTFSTDISKVNNNNRELVVGQKGVIEGIDYTIQRAEVSSTSTEIEVAFDASKVEQLFTIERAIQFNFLDQNGMPIQILDFHGTDHIYKYILAPLSDEVTEIQVVAYAIPFSDKRVEIQEELEGIFPQTISQGEMGELVVTKVEKEGDEYMMTFHSTSDFPFDARFSQNIIDIVDENGNTILTDYPKAIGPNKYQLKYYATSGKVFIDTIKLPTMKIEESAKVRIFVK